MSQMYDGRVVMHYKEFATDEVWLPAKKKDGNVVENVSSTGDQIIETDPKGIDLFDKPLPSEQSMREAPFAFDVQVEPLKDGKGTKKVEVPRFDKDDVLAAAQETMKAAHATGGVAQTFDEEDAELWNVWHAEAPADLAQVPAELRATFKLPEHGFQATAQARPSSPPNPIICYPISALVHLSPKASLPPIFSRSSSRLRVGRWN